MFEPSDAETDAAGVSGTRDGGTQSKHNPEKPNSDSGFVPGGASAQGADGDDTARWRASEEPCGTVQRDGLDETGIKPILGGGQTGPFVIGKPAPRPLARQWTHLARSYEFSESLERFLLDAQKAKDAVRPEPPDAE